MLFGAWTATLVSVLLASLAASETRRADQNLPPNSPPSEVQNAICRPELDVDGQDRRTGTAFVLETDGLRPRLLLVMAQHLFRLPGPGGEAVPWAEMPVRASSASCLSLDQKRLLRTGPALAIPNAHSMGPLSTLRDIAAFPLTAGPDHTLPLRALHLARTRPKAHQFVWLVAQTADHNRPGPYLFRATVLNTFGFLAYVYADSDLDLSNTSGAPVVDANGDVVGVNVGVGRQAGATIGIADGLDTIRQSLSSTVSP